MNNTVWMGVCDVTENINQLRHLQPRLTCEFGTHSEHSCDVYKMFTLHNASMLTIHRLLVQTAGSKKKYVVNLHNV